VPLHARAGVVEDLDVGRDAFVLDDPVPLPVVDPKGRDLDLPSVDELRAPERPMRPPTSASR